MKQLIQLEELALLIMAVWLFSLLPYDWWWLPVCILAPDISMIGYAFGNRAGAFAYNFFHHKAVAIGTCLAGLLLKNEVLQFAGIILFAHSCLDRIFGYGLKYKKGFKFTHLGEIGKK